MIGSGIKASQLIKKLQEAIKKHGDKEVFAGGTDYPEGVKYVTYQKRDDDGYIPKGSFIIG